MITHMGGDPAYPLSKADAAKCDKHTEIFRRTINILECAAGVGKSVIAMENPADPGRQPMPSVFATEEARVLRNVSGAKDFVFDQCMFGLEYRKATQILSNADLSSLAKLCNHGVGAHRTLRGKNGVGGWNTTSQAWYPSDLCQALAQALLSLFVSCAGNAGAVGLGLVSETTTAAPLPRP